MAPTYETGGNVLGLGHPKKFFTTQHFLSLWSTLNPSGQTSVNFFLQVKFQSWGKLFTKSAECLGLVSQTFVTEVGTPWTFVDFHAVHLH